MLREKREKNEEEMKGQEPVSKVESVEERR